MNLHQIQENAWLTYVFFSGKYDVFLVLKTVLVGISSYGLTKQRLVWVMKFWFIGGFATDVLKIDIS